ncbi:MAG: HRDC domain-containing protein [Chitinophagaceae bacterium]|nr:HRDC domain-containing protein [Chitinophagaceae bacterium]
MHATQHQLPPPGKIPVIYVTTADALASCINQLAQAEEIAFDLEFDRNNFTYGFNLCLMQIASDTHCYFIDPKAGLDMTLAFSLLENPAIHKVVHCSSEDLRLLHHLKCYPANLADTELYAKLLNYERTSLGAMIQQLFGIELDKKMQKVNWGLRPLRPEQLDYAANDVLYLLPLKALLEKQGAEKNMLPFFRDENNLLSSTIHSMEPKDNFLKKNDLRYLSPCQQYILNGLFSYRDKLAQQQNRPVHYIMNDETIRNLASNKISRSDFQNIKGIHPEVKNKDGQSNLFDYIKKLHIEANNKKLSHKRNYVHARNVHFITEKAAWELVKASIFTPIQNDISAQFGEHAMRFIFSTATVNAIVQGQLKIEEIKAPYRKMLIKSSAQKLGKDLSGFT